MQGVGPVVALRADGYLGNPNFARLRARMLVEKMLLLALGIGQGGSALPAMTRSKFAVTAIACRNSAPSTGTCAVRPTWFRLFAGRKMAPKPGFLVADVIPGAAVTERAVAAFRRRAD